MTQLSADIECISADSPSSNISTLWAILQLSFASHPLLTPGCCQSRQNWSLGTPAASLSSHSNTPQRGFCPKLASRPAHMGTNTQIALIIHLCMMDGTPQIPSRALQVTGTSSIPVLMAGCS